MPVAPFESVPLSVGPADCVSRTDHASPIAGEPFAEHLERAGRAPGRGASERGLSVVGEEPRQAIALADPTGTASQAESNSSPTFQSAEEDVQQARQTGRNVSGTARRGRSVGRERTKSVSGQVRPEVAHGKNKIRPLAGASENGAFSVPSDRVADKPIDSTTEPEVEVGLAEAAVVASREQSNVARATNDSTLLVASERPDLTAGVLARDIPLSIEALPATEEQTEGARTGIPQRGRSRQARNAVDPQVPTGPAQRLSRPAATRRAVAGNELDPNAPRADHPGHSELAPQLPASQGHAAGSVNALDVNVEASGITRVKVQGGDAPAEPIRFDAPQQAPGRPEVNTASSQIGAEARSGRSMALDSGNLGHVDRVRFVQRVARAFQTAFDRGAPMRLRLSPPELGSVQLEIRLESGVLSARAMTESEQARALLVEHLPDLRERLAQQDVHISRFDVDYVQERPHGAPHQQGHADNREQNRAGGRRVPAAKEATIDGAGRVPASSQAPGRLDVRI